MEKRDLYDINKNLTGETIIKGNPIPDGRYIFVVLIFIQNSKGNFLIQKRSLKKDGKYGSTGGHPKSGESSLQGIITEVQEEIGLALLPSEIELIYSGRADNEHVFFDIYYTKKDLEISELVLEKDEVDFVEWMSISKIKKLIESGEFLKNHAEEVYRMIDIFKNKGINLE